MGRNHPGKNQKIFQVVCFESSKRWVRRQLIHFFKEGQSCKVGKEILQTQLSILTKTNVNPFEIDKPEFLIVDADNTEDESIDIM